MRVVLWYALLGHEVVALKTMYREVSQLAFLYTYCMSLRCVT